MIVATYILQHMTEKGPSDKKCRNARNTACRNILRCTAECKGEQLHFQMPIALDKCKCKKFWKVFLLKFPEETISRNPRKGVTDVQRCLRLQDQLKFKKLTMKWTATPTWTASA